MLLVSISLTSVLIFVSSFCLLLLDLAFHFFKTLRIINQLFTIL